MRKINLKNFSIPPEILTRNSAAIKINRAFQARDGKQYNGHHYKADAVRNLLRAFSLGKVSYSVDDDPKCYYCESNYEAAGTLQVEHYRPKDGIDTKDNNGVAHPGYFWLGLEWSNLLLSCSKCNGRGNKGNRFPILGPRLVPVNPVDMTNQSIDRTFLFADEYPLTLEQPLLLNPETDEPKNHLTFTRDAQIHGTDDKGRVSVEVLGLQRLLLLKNRKSVMNEYLKEVKVYIVAHKAGRGVDDDGLAYLVGEKLKSMVIDAQDLSKPYVLWRQFYCTHFITSVLPEIDRDYRIRVLEIFRAVKAEYWRQ